MPIPCFKSTFFSLANHSRNLLGKRNSVRQQNFSLLYIHILTRAKYTYISQLIFFPLEKNCIFKRYLTVQKWPIMPLESMNLQENSVIKNYWRIKVTSAKKFRGCSQILLCQFDLLSTEARTKVMFSMENTLNNYNQFPEPPWKSSVNCMTNRWY